MIQYLSEYLSKGFYWELRGFIDFEGRKHEIGNLVGIRILGLNKKEFELMRKEMQVKDTVIIDLQAQKESFQNIISDMNEETKRLNFELTESLEITKTHGLQISEQSSKIQDFNCFQKTSIKKDNDQKLEINSLKSEILNLKKEVKEKDTNIGHLE